MLVGITGNFVSGKSAVAAMLGSRGYRTVDADAIAKNVYRKKGAAKSVAGIFGKGAMARGKVDTTALAKLAFTDAAKLKRLNRAVHPLVASEIKKILHKGKIVFVEVPLLFEARMESLFDSVILVKSSLKKAIERGRARGFSAREIGRRRSFQQSWKKSKKKADFVLGTGGTKAETKKQAEKIVKQLNSILRKG
ncbi:MAG: dephospho-CoA kinase [archaeon]